MGSSSLQGLPAHAPPPFHWNACTGPARAAAIKISVPHAKVCPCPARHLRKPSTRQTTACTAGACCGMPDIPACMLGPKTSIHTAQLVHALPCQTCQHACRLVQDTAREGRHHAPFCHFPCKEAVGKHPVCPGSPPGRRAPAPAAPRAARCSRAVWAAGSRAGPRRAAAPPAPGSAPPPGAHAPILSPRTCLFTTLPCTEPLMSVTAAHVP